ncbi:sensor histidine kinase [Roseimaritima sediminicola]|uniref:sensor histidine kinase n=1 Tax=Roseimaritima sediminicola TaxID=2662066 RepID=UPI001386A5D3|nr:HAMP domain-containing sensor histidine kinase [Roseimaritima sediminicola]
MSLLPCLRWSRSRWWLPLEKSTADLLADVLLDAAETAAERHRGALRERLRADPALLIYAVLRGAEGGRRPPDVVSVPRLADRLLRRLPQWLGEADRQLHTPGVDAGHRRRWQELARRALQLPLEDRLLTAPQWLRVLGPPVPPSWQSYWPRLRDPEETRDPDEARDPDEMWAEAETQPLEYAAPTLSLHRLAGLVRRERSLRERFDARLAREKLASLKQFAYGLTHEINNPLANIVTRSQQLQADESDPQRVESLERVVAQAMRAHSMLSDVMFFAHPPRPRPVKLDLQALVADVVAQAQAEAERVRIDLHVAAGDALFCHADPALLHDAVAALVRNALEAVGSDGRIVARCAAEGNRLTVEVADSGPGVSEEARRHAFDPYYSGREAGRGLGLGLCRVYRVASLHQGGAELGGGLAGCVARFWIHRGDLL